MLHTTILEDPDVAAAVADFTATVIEIRERSKRWFYSPEGSQERGDEQAALNELTSTMVARCDRIGISLDDLFRQINADLATRRNKPAEPIGDHQRFLLDENSRAYGAEHTAERERARLIVRQAKELEAANEMLGRATQDRIAADRLCGGIYAGWAIRGRTFS